MEKKEKNIKEQKAPKQKKEKVVKLVKKAPSFYRKQYTKKKLEKKIYKKIFVPADKSYIQGLIVETGKKGKKQIPVYGIPKDQLFSKKDFKRLKVLAKQIKKQKGRFRIAPFAAVAIFIAAFACAFTLTKNLVIKKVIKSTCESIFEARCDIAKVDFKFFGASLRINKFEIANKSDTMKDLVYIDSIALDFDLTQALRARFVADELSITGVASGTDRTYDGALPPKDLEKIKKKKAKEEKEASKDSALGSEIQKRLTAAKSVSMDSVTGLFDQYNPQTIIQNCYNSLQTPEVSKNVQTQIPELITKWQNKPAELEKSYNETKASVEELLTYDYGAISNDPVKVAEMVKLFDSGIKTVQNAKASSEALMADIKNDADTVTKLSADINAAIQHDTQFASSEIDKIKSFSLKDSGMNFITDLLDNVMYQLLGSYYPYYQKISQKLMDMKASSSKKPANENKVKVKKQGVSRAAGRNVIYRADTVPNLWIKKAVGSGPNFSFSAKDISSDMNKLNRPATGQVDLDLNNISHHCDLTVDIREASEDALVTASYSGQNYPFKLDSSVFGGGPGTPSFDAKTQIDAVFKAFENEAFSISGKGLFENLVITSQPFEPEYAFNIYSGVMSQIKSMDVNADIAFAADKGLTMKLASDVNKQFANALTNEMNKQISAVKDKAMIELKAKITELSGGALGDIQSFDAIKSQVGSYTGKFTDLENQLKNKQNGMQSSAKQASEKAMNDAKTKAEEEAKKQAGNLLKGLF